MLHQQLRHSDRIAPSSAGNAVIMLSRPLRFVRAPGRPNRCAGLRRSHFGGKRLRPPTGFDQPTVLTNRVANQRQVSHRQKLDADHQPGPKRQALLAGFWSDRSRWLDSRGQRGQPR